MAQETTKVSVQKGKKRRNKGVEGPDEGIGGGGELLLELRLV